MLINFINSAVWPNPESIQTKIVFCGDPKQLGPVLKSNSAIGLGFSVSLMEYLMQKPSYQRDCMGKYDPRFVVQLTKNYRCHPMILKAPNDIFYDGTLQACASSGMCDF